LNLKEYLISNKKRSVLLISIMLIMGGVIPLMIFTFFPDPENPYTIKQITLESETDETKIQALLYTPHDAARGTPGIVVAHGFCGNKQYMQPLSIELVKRGFTVVAIDFRGHGSSEGELPAVRRALDENPIDGDMLAAVNYLEDKMDAGHIGLVGHSMGGATSLRVSQNHPDKIEAVVSIGMIGTDYKLDKISNVLMAFGRLEQIFSQQQGLEFLEEYTGKKNVEIGKLYGDFDDGDATKVILGNTEHLFEVIDPVILEATVQWFEQAFNGEEANDVVITVVAHQISFLIALTGVTMLCFLLIYLLKEWIFQRKEEIPTISFAEEDALGKVMILYILGALLGAILFLLPFSYLFQAVPVSMGHILYAFIVGMALGLLLMYYLIKIRPNKDLSLSDIPQNIRGMCPTSPYRSLSYGVIAGLILTTAISALMHWSTNAAFLTLREIGAVFGMVILFFPFLFIKEFFLRNIHERVRSKNRFKEYFSMVGVGIFVDNLLIILLAGVSWQNPNSDLGFIALSMTAVIIFSVIQHFLVTWIYMNSGRNILGSTMALCIIYGWMIVNFFPFGVNSGFF